MDAMSVIINIFLIFGILFLVNVVYAAGIFLYGYVEGIMLRRRIPEQIKKEVEDARLKKDARIKRAKGKYAQSNGGECKTEGDIVKLPDNGDNKQSKNNEQDNTPDGTADRLDIQHTSAGYAAAGAKLRRRFSRKESKEGINEAKSL